MFQAGIARREITPFWGVELTGWGYYIERRWQRVHDPLYATALVVDDDVVRLEVAVDHAPLVREAGGQQDLLGDADRVEGIERAVLDDDLLERAALEVLHRDVVGAVPLAAVVDADDVRVLQARRGGGLAPEPLARRLVQGERGLEVKPEITEEAWVDSSVG